MGARARGFFGAGCPLSPRWRVSHLRPQHPSLGGVPLVEGSGCRCSHRRIPKAAVASNRGCDRRRPERTALVAAARLRRRPNCCGKRLCRRVSRVHDHAGCHPDSPCHAGRDCYHFSVHRPGSGTKTQAPQRTQVFDVHSRRVVDVRSNLGAVHLPVGRETSAARVVSPVDADLSSLPPVTIHASSDELLLPDAELMAKRLEATGIRCDLHLWDGQVHDFPLAADILPEGRRAIRYIGDFVKDVTTGSGSAWRTPVSAIAG
jgi:hypothetical protein